MVSRMMPPKFLAWAVLTVAAAGGVVAAWTSLDATSTQDEIRRNGDLTACLLGREAEALRQVGREVIDVDQLEADSVLGSAFADLEEALSTVNVERACEAIDE